MAWLLSWFKALLTLQYVERPETYAERKARRQLRYKEMQLKAFGGRRNGKN